MTGVPLIVESYSEYQAMMRSLVAAKTIQEAMQICWDLRLCDPLALAVRA